MRPRHLDEMVGQSRLLAPSAALRRMLNRGHVHSMILWGPPGCGKTTLSQLIAQQVQLPVVVLSAVSSGAAQIRQVLAQAQQHQTQGSAVLLFVDEVHRLNHAQQDLFLPALEQGAVVFIGATTENPSFALTSALLSRCRVYALDPVSATDIVSALMRALGDAERGLKHWGVTADIPTLEQIAAAADGDVRRAITVLECCAELARAEGKAIDQSVLTQVFVDQPRRFDQHADQFYQQISALHKCVRNSHPDAALYWLTRMLDGGCPPAYLARRLLRIAIEDIGLADLRAQSLALDAWQIYERLGSPEGELALVQATLYLATTAKSNAGYRAYQRAQHDVKQTGSLAVPLSLRPAPTALMKSLGYGQGYPYDPDTPGGIAFDQAGFPEQLVERVYYQPGDTGLESKLKEKLTWLRQQRACAVQATNRSTE